MELIVGNSRRALSVKKGRRRQWTDLQTGGNDQPASSRRGGGWLMEIGRIALREVVT